MGLDVGVHLVAEPFDFCPGGVGVRLGYPRRFTNPLDGHIEGECALAGLHPPGDRRGGGRMRGRRQRDVAFARQQAGGGVEPHPAGARQVGLGPRVQVGEVGVASGGAIQGLLIGLELNQIAGDEAGGDAGVAQDLHQQPGGIPAGAAPQCQRFVRRLHPGLHADDVLDLIRQVLIEAHQKIHQRLRLALRLAELGQPRLQARPDRLGHQVRIEILQRQVVVVERIPLGALFEEEVERIEHRELRHEIDPHHQFVDLVGKYRARLKIAERILLPVEEVALGFDVQGIAQHRRAAVRRRAQADDLGAQGNAPVVAIASLVLKSDANGHGDLLFERAI